MRRPTIIILSCIGFMTGVVFGYYFRLIPNWWWLVFVITSVVSTFYVSKKIKFIPLCLALIIIGSFVVTYRIESVAKNGISEIIFKKSAIEGTVVGDPYWDQDRNYVFVITDLKVNGVKKPESIKIKTFSSAVKEGYRLKAEGKVYPSQAKPGYTLSYAKITIITATQPLLVQVKNHFYKGTEVAVGGEPANFIKGIVVGARSSLAKDLQDTLNATGLSHVVAVSGYNLTILVVLMQKILRRRWAWGGLMLSLALVWAFVGLTGGSASILRAAIMASVFLIASYYGRQVSIFVCLGITAVLTLLINPTAVVDDLGWQLSFLSLSGIVVLTPILQKILPKRPSLLFEIIAVTLAAQIVTVPYILYIFGKYSAVAFLSNILIMPIIPFLMLAGFLAAIAGLILPNSAYLVGRFLNKLIDYVFDFLRYLQNQKQLSFNSTPDFLTLIAWYLIIVLLGIVVYNKGLGYSFQKDQELVK